jgi:hypothetical protein
MFLASVTVAGCTAMAVLLVYGTHHDSHKPSIQGTASEGHQQKATPDPRFVNIKPPKIPAISSPDGQRVVVEMQNAYRCMHTSNWRAAQASLPKDAADAPASIEELAVSMRESLGLLPDSCYVANALPQIANPRTPRVLMDVLYNDLTSRPDPIKLRTFFLLAGIKSHPLAGKALDNLRTAMNSDYGTDWARWDQAISERLSREKMGMRGVSCRFH